MCSGGGVTPSLTHPVPQVLQGPGHLPTSGPGLWERGLAIPIIQKEPLQGHI